MPLCMHLHGHDEGPHAGWLGSLKGLRRDDERQKEREREERDGVEVLMERKEREEYEIEIKEKEPVNECIKIQTGGQVSFHQVSGKETEQINLHANSTVATGSLCINPFLLQQSSQF